MATRQLRRVRTAFFGGSPGLFLAISINAFGAGMFFPFALLYYQRVTDLSVASIGFAITSATLITLSFNPVAGILVDRFGARPLVVASQVVEAIGFVGYLLVSTSISLFFAAMVATAGTRMFYASFSTLIAESVVGADRDRWYGLVGVSQTIGGSLSGITASLLIGTVGLNGFRIIIVTNACCLVASALLIWKSTPRRVTAVTEPGNDKGLSSVLHDVPFLKLVACNGLFTVCSMMSGVGAVLFVIEVLRVPLWWIAVTGLVNSILIVGLQSRVVAAIKGVRRTRVMSYAGLLWILACLLFALGMAIPDHVIMPYVLLAGIVFTASQLLYVPSSRALAAAMAPPQRRGRYIAAFEFSYGLAAAIAPALFGFAYDRAPVSPWLLMIAIILFAVILLQHLQSRIAAVQDIPVLEN
jgi:MFS family permease